MAGRPARKRVILDGCEHGGTCRSARAMLSLVVAVAIVTCVEVREACCETPSESSSTVGDHLDGFVADASERFGIPAAWLHAIIRVGGGGDARMPSRNGAIGLMRVMPETWTERLFRYAFGTDRLDPRDNMLTGAAHLREMYDRCGSKGGAAAFNMGPTRYDEHLKIGAPLSAETQAYVTVLAPLIQPGPEGCLEVDWRCKCVSWRKAPLSVAPPERSSSDKPLTPNVLAGRSSNSNLRLIGRRSRLDRSACLSVEEWRHDRNE